MPDQYVLLIGTGGRENELARKLAENPKARLIAATGNPGICQHARIINVSPDNMPNLLESAKEIAAQGQLITVVGPEGPLAAGIVDTFRENGLAIVGPTQAAARIETDKAFALGLMREHGIPTGRFRAFTPRTVREMNEAEQYALIVRDWDGRGVIKANGPAAGKGSYVCSTDDDVKTALTDLMLKRVHGAAGDTFVVMEHLGDGEELSMFWLVDKVGHIAYLGSAQDHKRLLDGDQGPNTGGMGAYSPVPFVNQSLIDHVRWEIVESMVAAMTTNGTPYTGFLYAGLIMTKDGPKVVEWNCRLGDPETQVILPLLTTDLLALLSAAEEGRLNEVVVEFRPGAACCVVLASEGYPGKPVTGRIITGIEEAEKIPGVFVSHAGTKREDTGTLVTAGGRVLGVTGTADNLPEAIMTAYAGAGAISFVGKQCRADIGYRGVRHLQGGS